MSVSGSDDEHQALSYGENQADEAICKSQCFFIVSEFINCINIKFYTLLL